MKQAGGAIGLAEPGSVPECASVNSPELAPLVPSPPQQVGIRKLLESYFGNLEGDAALEIAAQCESVELEGGENLFDEGDPGDALYFLVSGRLRALSVLPSGARRTLGDIEPGNVVGEMAVITDSVRSATVVATRDSVVLRIDAAVLRHWFIKYPQLLLRTSQLVINRTRQKDRRRRPRERIVNIALVPITPDIDMTRFCREFQAGLETLGSVLMLDPAEIDRLTGEPGLTNAGKGTPGRYRRLTEWLDQKESLYRFVVYRSDGQNSPWTQRCARQADRVVLVADAAADSGVGTAEGELARAIAHTWDAGATLALWHSEATVVPQGTNAWLGARAWVHEHVHVRRGDPVHAARLARIITGNAVGLVLGSGGARGLTHVGVFRAMEEAGIHIDRIGGTSIGSVIGAAIASDWSAEQVTRNTRLSFMQSPTGLRDMSLLPVISIYRGKRLDRLLAAFFEAPMAIEDLWLNFFCVSSDITTSREVVHTRGPLKKILHASIALPGIFPPVKLKQALHVDGAFMNALPVEEMGTKGVRKVYAVDLSFDRLAQLDFEETPGPLAYLYDKFVRGSRRRYLVPTLAHSLVQCSLLASEAKILQSRHHADVLFNPDVRDYDLMAWSSFDQLVEVGYEHAAALLTRLQRQAEAEADAYTYSDR